MLFKSKQTEKVTFAIVKLILSKKNDAPDKDQNKFVAVAYIYLTDVMQMVTSVLMTWNHNDKQL